MLKILLIRHGESMGNRERRMVGQLADGLTPTGETQCQQLASYLHQQEWRPTHIYSSPLQRAVDSLKWLLVPWGWDLPETAIAAHQAQPQVPLASPPQYMPAIALSQQLVEFHAGILTGLTWAEAQQQYPVLCHKLETSPDWVPIPEAETPVQGRRRAAQFIDRLLAQHSDQDAIWVVSHQWIMEHLIACVLGSRYTWRMAIPNTALFEFWLDRDRGSRSENSLQISDFWHVKQFGSTPHLSGER